MLLFVSRFVTHLFSLWLGSLFLSFVMSRRKEKKRKEKKRKEKKRIHFCYSFPFIVSFFFFKFENLGKTIRMEWKKKIKHRVQKLPNNDYD